MHPELMPGSVRFCTLPPGETKTEHMIVSRFHDLSSPATYEVQLSRVIARDEVHGLAISNKITITVEP